MKCQSCGKRRGHRSECPYRPAGWLAFGGAVRPAPWGWAEGEIWERGVKMRGATSDVKRNQAMAGGVLAVVVALVVLALVSISGCGGGNACKSAAPTNPREASSTVCKEPKK